jgi:hypothetical protein
MRRRNDINGELGGYSRGNQLTAAFKKPKNYCSFTAELNELCGCDAEWLEGKEAGRPAKGEDG